jgi:hypothetical protein
MDGWMGWRDADARGRRGLLWGLRIGSWVWVEYWMMLGLGMDMGRGTGMGMDVDVDAGMDAWMLGRWVTVVSLLVLFCCVLVLVSPRLG